TWRPAMPRPYVNAAINKVLTEALVCRMSRTESTPSSAKETAPIWIPIVFLALADSVCARAPATEARAPVDCKKKLRRFVSDKRSHLVICYSRNSKFHRPTIFNKGNVSSGAQQFHS